MSSKTNTEYSYDCEPILPQEQVSFAKEIKSVIDLLDGKTVHDALNILENVKGYISTQAQIHSESINIYGL